MYAVRLWSVRHARGLNALYRRLEAMLVSLDPLWRRLGYERIERPVAAVERRVKGLLFDCQMCGQCVLSSTGMSCPMNCPKQLRNGPCGGVRDNGHCEVKPEMRCVWVEAFAGAQRIPQGLEAMRRVQPPVDQRLKGRSSWLRVVRDIKAAETAASVGATSSAAAPPTAASGTANRAAAAGATGAGAPASAAPKSPTP